MKSAWALQAAEKLASKVGGGFNRRIRRLKSKRASVPEECFPGFSGNGAFFRNLWNPA
jgi:hypothetical protein